MTIQFLLNVARSHALEYLTCLILLALLRLMAIFHAQSLFSMMQCGLWCSFMYTGLMHHSVGLMSAVFTKVPRKSSSETCGQRAENTHELWLPTQSYPIIMLCFVYTSVAHPTSYTQTPVNPILPEIFLFPCTWIRHNDRELRCSLENDDQSLASWYGFANHTNKPYAPSKHLQSHTRRHTDNNQTIWELLISRW